MSAARDGMISLLIGLTLVFASDLRAQPVSTPPPTPPPQTPPAPSTGVPGAPRLPPFAGTLVNFDRRGERIVACVDRSTIPVKPKPGPAAAPDDAKPAAPKMPPAYRIWLIEREVMQELMTTGGLCDPSWAPDGKTFAAAGPRGVFSFSPPNYQPHALVAGQPRPATPAPSSPASSAAPPESTFGNVAWSPSGNRLAFIATNKGVTAVKVVDAKDGASVFSKEQPVKLLQWGADDKSLLVDGARLTVP